MTTTTSTRDRLDLAGLDDLLSTDEKDVRATVRQLCETAVDPYVADWFERGEIDDVPGLAKDLGSLGLLGMHLDGYGCAGMTATEYGLACLELEASDSGVRSLVSVQGSLAMYAIHRFGSEEQKNQWLPAMAAGEAIGCFGLTEPDVGSDPGSQHAHPGPARRCRLGARRPEDVDHERLRGRRRRRVGTDRRRDTRVRRTDVDPGVLGTRDQAQAVSAAARTPARCGPSR